MPTLQTVTTRFVVDEGGNREKGIIIRHDPDAESPREWDNLGVMVCWHRRYNLGDKHGFTTRRACAEALAVELGMSPEKAEALTDIKLWGFIQKKNLLILDLYLYDHSGITMNTSGFSCPWDSGWVGWIYATPDMIRKCYGVKVITKAIKERARSVLVGEVATYDQYLRGDVYWYECVDEDGETVDSCSGFYGQDPDQNGMRDNMPEEYRTIEPVFN